MNLTFHDNKDDYTASEIVALKQAFDQLEIKAQGGELSIDETRIRVAHIRLQREGNFKIVVEAKKAAAKVPKEPKAPKEKVVRKSKASRPAEVQDDIAKAQSLWFKQNIGGVLTEEEKAFVDAMLPPPIDI
jgi:hypothetical protein